MTRLGNKVGVLCGDSGKKFLCCWVTNEDSV